jgi:hypothetical protein
VSRRRASEPKAPPPPSRATAIEKAAVAPAAGGSIALDGGWRAELREVAAGALLRVWRPSGGGSPLELEVRLTETGPVVRARVSALEIESEGDLVARCEAFRVEARQAIDLVSSGTLRAEGRQVAVRSTHGSALVEASDDVQLLGEQVLLNCDRPAPLPPWVPIAPSPERTIARKDEGGDADLLSSIDSDRFARKDEAR